MKTMVHEIVRHPQTDFALSLAFELGPWVGDLFEEYLVEQSSAHKTSKEKVQFDMHIAIFANNHSHRLII